MLPGGNAGVSWKHCLTTQSQQKFDIKSYLCLSFSEQMKTQELLWWETIPGETHLDPAPSSITGEKMQFLLTPAKIPSNPRKPQHLGQNILSRTGFPEFLQMCGCEEKDQCRNQDWSQTDKSFWRASPNAFQTIPQPPSLDVPCSKFLQ